MKEIGVFSVEDFEGCTCADDYCERIENLLMDPHRLCKIVERLLLTDWYHENDTFIKRRVNEWLETNGIVKIGNRLSDGTKSA